MMMARDAKDYAVEFGGYLATAADNFLKACNAVQSAQMLSDFGAAKEAEELFADTHETLRMAIHEFRKRVDRAPPTSTQET